MLIRGCHAPVLVRQGTAEMRHRAPTYRKRWVKNDGSGTLGYFGDQRSPGNWAAFFAFFACLNPYRSGRERLDAAYYRKKRPPFRESVV